MDLPELIDTFRDPLIGLIASWGPQGADAIHLAQDSLAQAWLKRASCRGDWREPAVFGPWLRGVARNVVRNWQRAERRRRDRVVTSEEAVRAAAAPGEETASERLDALRTAIDALRRREREVVLMHYLGQTPIADVAALLGVSARAVEGRLYRAREALRRRLEGRTLPRALQGVLACL